MTTQKIHQEKSTYFSYILDICQSGSIEELKRWIETNNINQKVGSFAPLHFISMCGHVEKALDKGANINEKNNDGETPLHIALARRNVELAKLLIINGADIHQKDKFGHSPLHFTNNIEMVKLLIDKGVNIHETDKIGYTPLYYATDNVEKAKLLIDKGANVNEKTKFGTPLHYCSKSEDALEMAKLLIDNEADIHEKDKVGNTPLHYASESGSVKVAKLLIDTGANIHEKNNDGNTPLHLASQKGQVAIAKLLINIRSNIHEKNRNGHRPFYYPSQNWMYIEISKLLIDKGAIIYEKEIQLNLLPAPVKDYILKHLEINSFYRTKIFSLFGQFPLSSYATINPPNIGFVNLMRTCKYPAYYWAINSGFYSEMICLVLCYLSVISSPFVDENNQEEASTSIKWRNMQEIFGMEMLMEITYRHLMHVRKTMGREICNIRSLYDSEFATTAIEEVYGKRICNILYDGKTMM